MRSRFQVLFLLFVVLGIYYPTIFAGVNSVDDAKMLLQLEDVNLSDWPQRFRSAGALYYRPLLWMTFYADKFFWNLEESFMHLENLLLHAVNVVLVFAFARRIMGEDVPRELPLVAALVFALHPLNVEPVAWISGRTDPLAALFVLLSACLLLVGIDRKNPILQIIAGFTFLFGCMAKEVALFFFPVGLLIAWYRFGNNEGGTVRQRLVRLSWFALPVFTSAGIYLGLRLAAIRDGRLGLSGLLSYILADPLNSLRIVLKAFGFYVKKLFFPYPLNFAITSASDHYLAVGIVALFGVLVLLVRGKSAAALLVSAALLIIPSFFVALKPIAWTPLAERYMYLPSAFFAIGITWSAFLAAKNWRKERAVAPLLFAVMVPVAFTTADRVLIWQDNLKLYQDAVRKNPTYWPLRNELAIAMTEKGMMGEAKKHLSSARALGGENLGLPAINEAKIAVAREDLTGARKILKNTFTSLDSANLEVLKMLLRVDEIELRDGGLSKQAFTRLQKEILEVNVVVGKRNGDAAHLYRAGQMALFLGERTRAAELFNKAHQGAPDGAFYKTAAGKLAATVVAK